MLALENSLDYQPSCKVTTTFTSSMTRSTVHYVYFSILLLLRSYGLRTGGNVDGDNAVTYSRNYPFVNVPGGTTKVLVPKYTCDLALSSLR